MLLNIFVDVMVDDCLIRVVFVACCLFVMMLRCVAFVCVVAFGC